MSVTIHVGDCREVLATLPDASVNCCVTSPPYFGLRDYGHDGQIGLEQTPEAFVAEMVAVFREVRRVLRDDGTLWLNLGDSYARNPAKGQHKPGQSGGKNAYVYDNGNGRASSTFLGDGLKEKDLIGIPWMTAFALRADGWVLRQEIVWAKMNPMPESVQDRCTKSHEQIFLFAKAKWSGPDNGRFAHISDEDARWLALLIDAEGCIVVKRNRHEGRADTFAPQVSIGNTSETLMREVVRIVGHGNLLERTGKNCRMLYWQLANGLARDFLHRIYPFLIVKQRQARIGIYVDSLTYARGGQTPERKQRSDAMTAMLTSLWERNKLCNRFGEPDLSDVPEPERGRWSGCHRYYFDAKAIAEPAINAGRVVQYDGTQKNCEAAQDERMRTRVAGDRTVGDTRNRRSVWEVATQAFSEAHFATFPPALIEPCILAGAPAGGVVLDPFGGAGTTGLVADRLQRDAILIELNPAYADMARRRIHGDAPLLAEVA